MNTFEVENNNRLEAMVITNSMAKLASETWTRDPDDPDFWHGPHGVIVNTAALEYRKAFFEIILQEA
ncbi:MAG: hypothetical protein KC422_13910 [Trueperaceae bacterium]|nr:hypothetical protein [Trueperaceae bacterium]